MLTLVCIAAVLSITPPRVVSASPDMADVGVDPALKEITIEFDQEMSPAGRSICGGGDSFPKVDGSPRWASPRKFVIPVQLAPGKLYSFSINCQAARNFRSAAGEAAEAYPISFRTEPAAEAGAPAAARLTVEQSAAALVKLREAIDQRYSYRELRAERGLDWVQLFDTHGPLIAAARTPAELGRRIATMLRATDDLHVSVRVQPAGVPEPFTIGVAHRDVSANMDFRALPKLITGWSPLGKHAYGGTYREHPYLLITDWSGKLDEYQPVLDFLDKHRKARAIIVDVRPNGGGDESIARKVAALFTAKPAVYSRCKVRDPSRTVSGGWMNATDRVIEPERGHPLSSARVAVLIGPVNMSSNESFILMMKHGAAATLVGARTAGSSGRPMPAEIAPGVTVLLPSWIDYLPNGDVLEGRGVEPDIAATFTAAGGKDEVLDRAVEAVTTP